MDFIISVAKRLMSEKSVAAILGLMVSIGIGLGLFAQINRNLGLKDENPIEELVEEGLHALTGEDKDLTPDSPED